MRTQHFLVALFLGAAACSTMSEKDTFELQEHYATENQKMAVLDWKAGKTFGGSAIDTRYEQREGGFGLLTDNVVNQIAQHAFVCDSVRCDEIQVQTLHGRHETVRVKFEPVITSYGRGFVYNLYTSKIKDPVVIYSGRLIK